MISTCRFHVAELIGFMKDASNFQNSTLWDLDTTSGVGGWGDPNDDYQLTTGGFADDFLLSYPVPHRLRRQYIQDDPRTPGKPLADEFTPESQDAMVNGFVGSFVGFQAEFQAESHAAIHFIVGGCVGLLNLL